MNGPFAWSLGGRVGIVPVLHPPLTGGGGRPPPSPLFLAHELPPSPPPPGCVSPSPGSERLGVNPCRGEALPPPNIVGLVRISQNRPKGQFKGGGAGLVNQSRGGGGQLSREGPTK